MALQESLKKLKQQQEKCQSTLTGIAARAAASKTPQSFNATPANTPSERLQHINAVRKTPVGAQIKRVIDLLLETHQAFTPEQINEACYVDINANKAVFDSLRSNHKVNYDGKLFSYKSKHDLTGKDQLLSLIQKFPEGLPVVDLKDSYTSVMDDLQALKAAGQVWMLFNMDSQEDMVYPNDPKVTLNVDDDLKEFFWSIELPCNMDDIEKDLRESGMKPSTNTAKRQAMAQVHGIPSKLKPKKPREVSRRTKLRNTHLPELFQNLNGPDPI